MRIAGRIASARSKAVRCFGLRREHEPQPPSLRGDGQRQLIDILRRQAIALFVQRHRHRLDPVQRCPQFVIALQEFVCTVRDTRPSGPRFLRPSLRQRTSAVTSAQTPVRNIQRYHAP